MLYEFMLGGDQVQRCQLSPVPRKIKWEGRYDFNRHPTMGQNRKKNTEKIAI